MTPHVKIYLDYFDLTPDDFCRCEACGGKGVDIHHILGRGKGMDVISNLAALCRDCHNRCHNEEIKRHEMQKIHFKYLMQH